jgi:hypothetical protein
VGRTERTLQRWEREFGFPVHRPSGKSRSAVIALADEIQQWARGKPSLNQIRQTARLNQAKRVRHPAPVPDHKGLDDPIQNAAGLSSPEHGRTSSDPRLRLQALLRSQKTFRQKITNLTREQRNLLQKLHRTLSKHPSRRVTPGSAGNNGYSGRR